MCGIWAYFNGSGNVSHMDLYKEFMELKHRGPDHSSFQQFGTNNYIGFHRLSIMNPTPISNQPYVMELKSGEVIVFICNGEIYNYIELTDTFGLDIKNNSDCMTIPALYKKFEDNYDSFTNLFSKQIKGEFAFVMSIFKNNELSCVICGRDQFGIRPLYCGMYTSTIAPRNTTVLLSSEIKACSFFNGQMYEFEPGTIQRIVIKNNAVDYVDMYVFSWCNGVVSLPQNHSLLNETEYTKYLDSINSSVTACISRRLNADVPIGFLLSGGVDSSLVCAISSKILNGLGIEEDKTQIRTFCCGMEGGTDFEYARKVADYIGSNHTEVVFTMEEALAAINSVIYTTETWDTTTIRASVGQYLISSYISQSTDIKVLLVGEGPDEVCSSYLFNWYAPSPEDLHYAAVEYVSNIHKYDVRRVDRCSAMWGLEARVPYLDPEFIEAYWKIPAILRDPKTNSMEKYMLRAAFKEDRLLPDDVLFRRKEAFSDGISSTKRSWFEIIKEHIYKTHHMSEEDYYKKTFLEFFGKNREKILDIYWQPKWDSSGKLVTDYSDPSARTLSVYNDK
jgi:asparagine synthase (glutamine-hydrolysing)